MIRMFLVFLAAMVVAGSLVGCRANVPQDDNGQINTDNTQTDTNTPTQDHTNQSADSTKILENIWAKYEEDEKFSVYGGALENSVNDAPGALDVTDEEEMTTRYLLPSEMLGKVSEGASLVHMMNNNIFTAVVVKLSNSTEMKTVYENWRDTIQRNQWICGQPDRLLMANVDGSHLLMVFASKEAMDTFKQKMAQAYPQGAILYDEAIVS